MTKPNAKYEVELYTNDKVFDVMSKENKDKLNILNTQITDVIKDSVLTNFINELRNSGYTEEQISEIYVSE